MKLRLWSTLSVTILGMSWVGCGADATAPQGEPITGLFNYRYCEIVPVVPTLDEAGGASFYAYGFNSLGLNDCPEDQWLRAVDSRQKIREDWGALYVEMNGPRYWVLDELIGYGESTTGGNDNFPRPDGLEMTERFWLSSSQNKLVFEYWETHVVERNTAWVYYPGTPIFELTDPDGNVFVMQAYAQKIDPTLTLDDLFDLTEKLEQGQDPMPEGWTYSSRILEEKFVQRAAGRACIMRDNLYNTYQSVDPNIECGKSY